MIIIWYHITYRLTDPKTIILACFKDTIALLYT